MEANDGSPYRAHRGAEQKTEGDCDFERAIEFPLDKVLYPEFG